MEARFLTEGVRLAGRLLADYARRARDDRFDVAKLKLFVTKRCHQRCVHCGIGAAGAAGDGELTAGEIARLWSANPALQLVSFSGGEPLLRADLPEIALSAVDALPHLLGLSVNTSGWHTERVVELARAVLARLRPGTRLIVAVSSHGPPEVHDRIAGLPGSFERKERTLHALRELAARAPALRVRHNVNINPWNLAEVGPFIAAAEARGERCFVNHYLAASHFEHGPEHYAASERFREALQRDPRLAGVPGGGAGVLGRAYQAFARSYFTAQGPRQQLECFALRAFASVEADGTVRGCIAHSASAGRVQDHDFDLGRVLATPRARALRRAIREGRCRTCWTPNEAYVTLLCNLPNPRLWKGIAAAVAARGRRGP